MLTMKNYILFALIPVLYSGSPQKSNLPEAADVPASHWASKSVVQVVNSSILPLHGAKFEGDKKVTREEFVVALERLARKLEAGNWPSGFRAMKETTEGVPAPPGGVTRYELAATLDRVGRYFMKIRPNPGSRRFGKGVGMLPIAPSNKLNHGDPVYASLDYLAKNKMLDRDSILLNTGLKNIMPADVSFSVAAMIAGVNDRLTDQPADYGKMTFPKGQRK